jgi:hypothetical protein
MIPLPSSTVPDDPRFLTGMPALTPSLLVRAANPRHHVAGADNAMRRAYRPESRYHRRVRGDLDKPFVPLAVGAPVHAGGDRGQHRHSSSS